MNNIGARFKEIRTELGLSQQAFGSKLKVSKTHISKIELDQDMPSDRLISLACHELALEEEWLKHGIGTKYKDPVLTPYTSAQNTPKRIYKSLEPQNDVTINIMQTVNAEGLITSLSAAIEFVKILSAGEYDLLLQICKKEADEDEYSHQGTNS